MGSEQLSNKTLAKRWFEEVWNKRRIEAVDEIAGTGMKGHLEGLGNSSLDQFKAFHAALTGSFSDLHVDVDDVIAEASHVVLRWRLRGTHDGDALGIPASGRKVVARSTPPFTISVRGPIILLAPGSYS